jgi:hypothetical protein
MQGTPHHGQVSAAQLAALAVTLHEIGAVRLGRFTLHSGLEIYTSCWSWELAPSRRAMAQPAIDRR